MPYVHVAMTCLIATDCINVYLDIISHSLELYAFLNALLSGSNF